MGPTSFRPNFRGPPTTEGNFEKDDKKRKFHRDGGMTEKVGFFYLARGDKKKWSIARKLPPNRSEGIGGALYNREVAKCSYVTMFVRI